MKKHLRLTFALVSASLFASCASTTPSARFSEALSTSIERGDKVKTAVTSSDSRMLDIDRQRLSEKVTREVENAARPGSSSPRSFEIDLKISRYEKGNAFARAMLAGLGQIHIDGTATVYQVPGRKKTGEFTLNKTFAWGGIYGGSVTMDNIEDTYAKAVAEAVCGPK